MTDPKRNREAISLFEQALALDPWLAQAKAALARRVFFRAYTEDRKYTDEAIRLRTGGGRHRFDAGQSSLRARRRLRPARETRAVEACVLARVGARPESHRQHA